MSRFLWTQRTRFGPSPRRASAIAFDATVTVSLTWLRYPSDSRRDGSLRRSAIVNRQSSRVRTLCSGWGAPDMIDAATSMRAPNPRPARRRQPST